MKVVLDLFDNLFLNNSMYVDQISPSTFNILATIIVNYGTSFQINKYYQTNPFIFCNKLKR